MGFRDLVDFNKAMLGKQGWRLDQAPEALWSRIFKGLYFPHVNLWNATRGARPSWGWQSILVGRDALRPDLKWKVGDGKSINLREDRWLMFGPIGGPTNINDPPNVWQISSIQTHAHGRINLYKRYSTALYQKRFSKPHSTLFPDQIV